MSNPGLITFHRTDILPVGMESVVKEFADHFGVRREYVPEFCRLIEFAGSWDVPNMDMHLVNWQRRFEATRKGKKFVDLVKRAFKLCRNEKDVNKLRGSLLEALIIAGHGGAPNVAKSNYGWGATVIIDSVDVSYICPAPTPAPDNTCKRRSTVDFGHWNGSNGKFYECKVQPKYIGCKEVKYMTELVDRLKEKEISFEIIFVCAGAKEGIYAELLDSGISFLYQGIGRKEIQSMLA